MQVKRGIIAAAAADKKTEDGGVARRSQSKRALLQFAAIVVVLIVVYLIRLWRSDVDESRAAILQLRVDQIHREIREVQDRRSFGDEMRHSQTASLYRKLSDIYFREGQHRSVEHYDDMARQEDAMARMARAQRR